MRRWLVPLLLVPGLALAQDQAQLAEDRDFLTAFLEDNLSDAGRTVTITGFAGALSSRATIEELAIADGQGVWITLRGVVFDWNRSALLSGEVAIDELSADEIVVARVPVADGTLPSPEARGFSLPDLPVSVQIGTLAADRIVLDETLLGQAVEGRLQAGLSLSGGEGTARLKLERTDDGPAGQVTLDTGYSNATGVFRIDLAASEAAGGIATTALNIPGAPAVDLSVQGEGPLTEFAADVRLASAGTDRLTGTVTLQGTEDGAQRFAADLAGDLAPLFLPDYAAFFGPDVALIANGARGADGRLNLDVFSVRTRALALDGTLALAPDGTPERFALTGRLADPSGAPVLLPSASAVQTRIGSADLTLDFDAGQDDGWNAVATIRDLDRDDLRADAVAVRGSGRILQGAGANGTLALQASGLSPADPDLAKALGSRLGGSVSFDVARGSGILGLPQVRLTGDGYALEAAGQVSGLADGIGLAGQATLRSDDLSRFSGLAGRPLSGAADVTVNGSGSLLGGDFAAQVTVAGTDLAIGQTEADNLLRGPSRFVLSAQRDASGTTIRRLDVTARTLTAQARGTIASAGSDLVTDLDFTDLSVLGNGYGGRLTGQATLTGTPQAGRVTLSADGAALAIGQPQVDALLRGGSRVVLEAGIDNGTINLTRLVVTAATLSATAQGRIAPAGSDVTARLAFSDLSALGAGYRGALSADARFTGTPADGSLSLDGTTTDLAIGQPEADQLLAGRTVISVAATLADGAVEVDRASLANPQLTAEASGTVAGGARSLRLQARLANLGLFLPEFPGPVTLAGTATDQGARYALDLTGTGPGQIAVRIGGAVAADLSSADVTLAGSAQAGLANAFVQPRSLSGPVRFDLRLAGAPTLANLSGRVSLAGGRLSDPGLPFSLDGISASADLADGEATVTLTTGLTSGGGISANGTVGLAAPYPARLRADLRQVIARDPRLYQTRVNGTATVTGPLTGGAVIGGTLFLNETELRIPDTGFGASGAIDGLTHVGEPAAVRETRRNAGLLGEAEAGGGDGSGGSGQPFALDLTISAPNRVFVRGRGLDAELGGDLRLGGTTDAVVPNGGFELIRGRLDILGKRLVVTESSLRLEGSFDPLIEILASNDSDGIVSSVRISGRASAPDVGFVSVPPLPEEEVLARLLFGRGLANLSAFQAAQLAGAVASLAGRGGEGIVSRLRQGFGLDDLDVSTGADGGTEVTAGKYLSRNLYTEVVVGEDGQSEINLNLDVTDSITLRGTAGGDSGTGLGVFLERDY